MGVSMIEFAVAYGMMKDGHVLPGVDFAPAMAGVTMKANAKARPWTRDEDQFVIENYQYLTDEGLAEALGRSLNAVHLRWERELQLPARSRVPGLLTAHQAAQLLGIDSHKTAHWVDAGLIKGRNMPGARVMRLIEKRDLTAWAVNPMNWVYFDWRGITDPHLRRLCELRSERWGDEWWNTEQVCAYHGIDSREVKRAVKMGRLKGVRPDVSIGGRHPDRKWGFWFFLRSEATRPDLYFPRRGQPNPYLQRFTPAADAWILRARDELGMSFVEIGKTMKRGRYVPSKRSNPVIGYRYRCLKTEAGKSKVKG